MRIHYNVTGRERKALVNVIAGITGAHPIYRFMPTCAYDIGCFTVTKDGTLEFSEHMDSNEVEAVLHAHIEAGFEGVGESNAETADGEASDGEHAMAPTETETAPTAAHTARTEPDSTDGAGEDAALTISLPLDGFNPDALDRLTKLVDSKAALIRKALNAARLTIHTEGDKVSFSWWDTMPEPKESQAYMGFIAALGKMAREAKRVTAKEVEVESEKYAFRCFLVRLGFVGAEHKVQRKILMHRLSGTAAFPKEKADAFSAAQKARRNANKTTEQGGYRMRMIRPEELKRLREDFPVGTRVELVQMEDPGAPPVGTKGTVTGADSLGDLLVDWENGSGLNVVWGVDVVGK